MMTTTHHHLLRRAGVGGATASWPVPKASSSSWKEDPVAAVFKRMYAPNAGKRIAYGIFQKPIDDFSANNNGGHLTEEEKEKLREKASKEMTVIDEEERKRRGTIGRVSPSATACAAVLQTFIFHQPVFARLALFPLVYLSYGFLASERSGM